jgi:hypothetical protein
MRSRLQKVEIGGYLSMQNPHAKWRIDLRFRNTYEVPYIEAITDTKRILEEIVHLVEKQFPQINMATVYRRLSYIREAQNTRTHGHSTVELLE